MIPRLYADGLTAAPGNNPEDAEKELRDTISCFVEREINGIFELTMTYPITGVHYDEIALRSLLYVIAADAGSRQLFRIYRISKPLRGIVTINARHISYDLGGYVRQPFTSSTLSGTLAVLANDTYPAGCPFTFTTSLSKNGSYTLVKPSSLWSIMGGMDGSLLDKWHGLEYDFNNFSVSVKSSLGGSHGVVIEYGKNLMQLMQEENSGDLYTGIVPYYYTEDDGLVTTAAPVDASAVWPFSYYKAVDLTDRFQAAPTSVELEAAAQTYITNNNIGAILLSLDVDFVPLFQTEEYKGDITERVSLGDVVTVNFTALGVSATARAVAYSFDCLKEKYKKITVGQAKPDMGQVIQGMINNSTAVKTSDYPNARGVDF